MAKALEEKLLDAIKRDDPHAFGSASDTGKPGAYRLGRFPILSLLYMYNARKILSAHESALLRISVWERLPEPAEVASLFYEKAGKCLRLYFDEVVTPLEMLLILDNTKKVKKLFPILKPTDAIKKRLKTIYFIKHSLKISYSGKDIVMDRRPLNNKERAKLALICISVVLALAIIIGTPITLTTLIPNGAVHSLDQIDFASAKSYTLLKDIVVPDGFSVSNMRCTINGKGKKLILGKGASLGEMSGTLTDIVIETSGSPIFSRCTYTSMIENVTVNVSADDLEINSSGAFITSVNYGKMQSMTVNISGKLIAAVNVSGEQSVVFGAMVLMNSNTVAAMSERVYGIIKNCKVHYDDFTLVGTTAANASFGGIVGENNSGVTDCEVDGKITADTFDIAGVCHDNTYVVSGCVNGADLIQTATDMQWTSTVGGIAIDNNGKIENCIIAGSMDVSGVGAAMAGGIAVQNNSHIQNCTSAGSIKVAGTGDSTAEAVAGGIAIDNNGKIENCIIAGSMDVSNASAAMAGGIVAQNSADVQNCIVSGDIKIAGTENAIGGGIAADNFVTVEGSMFSGSVLVSAANVYAGGICARDFMKTQTSALGGNVVFVKTGTIDSCISEGTIAAVAGEGEASIGGIVGLLQEYRITGEEELVIGGTVTDCIFIGDIDSGDKKVGNIAGQVGAELYNSNKYTYEEEDILIFDGNFYVKNKFSAFGEIVDAQGAHSGAEDKGATPDTVENIKASELYKRIMEGLAEQAA